MPNFFVVTFETLVNNTLYDSAGLYLLRFLKDYICVVIAALVMVVEKKVRMWESKSRR